MNKKLLGISLAAVFAIGMIIPAIAIAGGDANPIANAKIWQKDTKTNLLLKTEGKIPTNNQTGLIGYGFFTDKFAEDGTILVATSHKGAYDNIGQGPQPSADGAITTSAALGGNATLKLCSPEEIDSGFCGADWHIHYARLGSTDSGTCESELQITSLSYFQPGHLKIKNNKLWIQNAYNETGSVIDFVTGAATSYAGNVNGTVVGFNLSVEVGVCVNPEEALNPTNVVVKRNGLTKIIIGGS